MFKSLVLIVYYYKNKKIYGVIDRVYFLFKEWYYGMSCIINNEYFI